MIVKNDLFDYKNRYIYQETDGFKFSLDSILLAEFVKIPKGAKKILDMCTGNAPIPLILSTKTTLPIKAFEIQKPIYDLAQSSVTLNKLENQIEVINEDILNIEKLFPGKYFDIITCNPPYFRVTPNAHINQKEILSIARHEIKINLDNIFQVVHHILSDNGDFYMVHRPERLDEIILTASKYHLKIKEIALVVTKQNQPSILLIHCQKHAKYGIKFRKVVDVSNLTTYQHLFEGDEN